jgi:hypothetical protein
MTQYILAPEALQDLHAVLDAVAVHESRGEVTVLCQPSPN